jgi:uncharacterized protein YbjT (DUF2867 family)
VLSERTRVLVIGGTRGTGKEITARLHARGASVRVLARDVSRAAAVLGEQAEVVAGDVTKPDSILRAIDGVGHVIFTAGVTKRPVGEKPIIAVEYDGVVNTLAAARAVGFTGRFLYMTAIGVVRVSLESLVLNTIKGNTLLWRRRAEGVIRDSGMPYTIVRCGVLSNTARHRGIMISQRNHRMSLLKRISRIDAAAVFVEALDNESTVGTTFDAYWSCRAAEEPLPILFSRLQPD